jgi:hypothetical protein
LPGKQVVGQVSGFEMKTLNFFQQVLGKHANYNTSGCRLLALGS